MQHMVRENLFQEYLNVIITAILVCHEITIKPAESDDCYESDSI